jgi:response regulator of citrate/malate metabolism
MLADLTGVQLAKILHKNNENIKFMFFSGNSDVSNIKDELGFNIYEVFIKPIDPDNFLEKLRQRHKYLWILDNINLEWK